MRGKAGDEGERETHGFTNSSAIFDAFIGLAHISIPDGGTAARHSPFTDFSSPLFVSVNAAGDGGAGGDGEGGPGDGAGGGGGGGGEGGFGGEGLLLPKVASYDECSVDANPARTQQ